MAVGNITNVIPASELPVMTEAEYLANVNTLTIDGTRGSSPNGRLIENPVSGFQIIKAITLPNGMASGNIYEEFITIADDASIPSPNGYILEVATSVTDADLTVQMESITRISFAVEMNK